jgi:hypothetical protein
MKALVNDQIHSPAFQKVCDYIWSDDVGRANKSGVWDYFDAVSKEFNKPLVNETNLPMSGVIFVGMCHILEDIFNRLPANRNFIFVHRTNDRPFTHAMYDCKPNSVKHIYTVDCRGKWDDVSAIPFGNASINGEDTIVKKVAKEKVKPAETKVFARYNVNPDTPHRLQSLPILKTKPFVKLLEEQIGQDVFYREVRSHAFTMALAGCGADASRQWAAIQLGSIPIVTDCPEMRHFEDLPLVFCPDFSEITEAWLNEKAKEVKGKSTERMRMSYWAKHIEDKRKEFGI